MTAALVRWTTHYRRRRPFEPPKPSPCAAVTPRRPLKAWMLTRDGVPFCPDWISPREAWTWRTRRQARLIRDDFKPGSNHRWAVLRIRITPIRSKGNAR